MRGKEQQQASAGGLLADDRTVAAPIPVDSAMARSIGEHPRFTNSISGAFS
jgi:hypothetical protein